MLMSWVRPGALDTRASCFWLARALISDDLPTFERPMNATSASESGSWWVRGADATNWSCSGRPDMPRSVRAPGQRYAGVRPRSERVCDARTEVDRPMTHQPMTHQPMTHPPMDHEP